jgi:hypothetical protein
MKGWAQMVEQATMEASQREAVMIPFSRHWTDEQLKGARAEAFTTDKEVLGPKTLMRWLWDVRGVVSVMERELALSVKRIPTGFQVRLVRLEVTNG